MATLAVIGGPPSVTRLTLASTDADSARDQVARTFAELDITVRRPRDLRFEADLIVTPRLGCGRMSYGAEVRMDAPPMGGIYHINLPLTGWSVVSQHGERGESRAGRAGVAFRPTGPLSLTWSADQKQYVVKFGKDQLEAHAARLTGRKPEPIDFDLTFDLSDARGQALLTTVGFVYGEMARLIDSPQVPAMVREFEALLMTQVLTVVPSQISPLLAASAAPVSRTLVHDALDVIDADPRLDMTTIDLAARLSVSVRSLQAAFQRSLGMTPGTYLRNARLDRVHEELLSGPDRTVTEVATDWGFYHAGRFAQQYRERFGVLPSRTVRS